MLLAVGLQVAVVAALAVVAGGVWGWETALSLAFGGAAAIVPNALFAVRLAIHRGRSPESYPVVFFLGEIVKIGLTVALLVWAATSMPQLRWPPLIVGLIAAVQAPFFVLFLARRRGDTQPADGKQGQGSVANRPQPPTIENR